MLLTLLLGGAFSVGQTDPQRQFATERMAVPPLSFLSTAPAPVTQLPFLGATPKVATPISTPAETPKPPTTSQPAPNGAPEANGAKPPSGPPDFLRPNEWNNSFHSRLYKAYFDEFFPDEKKKEEESPEAPRRALPGPFPSPPFPTAEYQGFPLIGVPPSDSVYPLMKAIHGSPYGDEIKDSRIKAYGWINASGNYSTSRDSNTPNSYWVAPNRLVVDQAVLRIEREPDAVQTDHVDWGFRATGDFGIDYRYFTAGGWFSDQLLVHNRLYGWDPTELYFDLFVPWVAQGMRLTVGRWIATPDIETQFSPDNYMGTHSMLFTIDVYTETGVMATVMLNQQWTVQAALHAGADMAPWYAGAVPTGMFGVRWVSQDNNDSVYTVLNAINNAEFQYFDLRGVPAGHHNYNIFQTTWQHKFSDDIHTKTEAYIMWERNAPVGGTPSIGPFQFNSGGGLGATVPGLSLTYAALNYTMFRLSDKDFLTVRNEWTKDEHGTRYGFAGNYTSHAIGLTHNFNSVLQVRPEIGYYRNWNNPAFDNGAKQGMWQYGFDLTYRF